MADMNPEDKRELKRDWLKPQSIIAIISLIFAFAMAYNRLEDHERRLTAMEVLVRSDHDILIEIRSDLKSVKSATTGKP